VSEMTLAEAAGRLGIAAGTLRAQVKNGRLRGRLIGKTWVVAEDEVERYRLRSRGRVGRPRGVRALSGFEGFPLGIDPAQLGWIAGRYGVRSFALFGSAARGEAGPESDVDIVMELEPSSGVGLLEHARIAKELAGLFGRRVDLVTWQSLRPRMRAAVERESVPLFAR